MLDQEYIRIKKIKEIRSLGINPYPTVKIKISDNIKNILKERKYLIKNKKTINLVGRIFNIRNMGISSFLDIKDYSNKKIQLYYNIKNLPKKYLGNQYYLNLFKKYLDIGDIIFVRGNIFLTKVKEYTVSIKKILLLSKSIYPIPIIKKKNNKIYYKFNNIEKRYRMRYLDLILNNKTKKIFFIRSLIIQSIRDYFNRFNYLEVDTPILQKIPGGAYAKPFVTYHNKLKQKIYLRISNELFLKKLIVGGFKGVYEFSRNFRNEGIDRVHNPEFTILELYVAYKDYSWMIKFFNKLLIFITNKLLRKNLINKDIYNFKNIRIVDFFKIINKYSKDKINENTSVSTLINICKKEKIEIESKKKEKILDDIFSYYSKNKLKKPTYIINYPKVMSPLAKSSPKNNKITERFEFFVNDIEIANAYTELNDPIEQYKRFKEQGNKIDHDFIKALKIGLPPTAGIGIGIDRLVALFTDSSNIQEVILFPLMK